MRTILRCLIKSSRLIGGMASGSFLVDRRFFGLASVTGWPAGCGLIAPSFKSISLVAAASASVAAAP
jgi:hypothetical protein